jgi:phenylpropionate dioxygenase-like ring-hydroxylating dioxygenase large terminal subunit
MPSDWTAAALSCDLPVGVVLPGRLGGSDLAIWRSATGRLSAWNDRCPHRGMRLSHGFVRGETLSCIYHGWTYGTDGGCTRIPAHPDLVPPAAIRTLGFACLEADGVIWVAPSGTASQPPGLDGYVPLRSVALSVQLSTWPGFVSTNGVLRGEAVLEGQPHAIALVPQPLAEGTMLHALAAPAAPKPAASRWLEALRRTIEEAQ